MVNTGASDHDAVFTKVGFYRQKTPKLKVDPGSPPSKRNYRQIEGEKRNEFIKNIASKPWDLVYSTDDVNTAAELFTNFITESLDKYAPFRRLKKTPS